MNPSKSSLAMALRQIIWYGTAPEWLVSYLLDNKLATGDYRLSLTEDGYQTLRNLFMDGF